MPRRNRVTPFGTLEAVAARGTLMGNRGDLHDASGRIARAWRARAWIACALSFRGWRAPFDTAGRWTPLFFTDEAAALAAGHRPCALCRRADYRRFVAAWRTARGIAPEARLTAPEIDAVLHRARLAQGRQATHAARLGDLPEGSFVADPAAPDRALLVWAGALHPWSWQGYGPAEPLEAGRIVTVLTPAPSVAALAAGYRPAVALPR
ncbi:MAG: hypothetical protein U1E53_25905 [Dongiaceae bacterium]